MKFYTSEELMKDPKWLKAITKRNFAFEVAEVLSSARLRMGYTQAKLAKKIGTKQAGVARAESGKGFPSLATIEKIAHAYKTNIVISFESMPDIKPVAVRYAKANEANTKAATSRLDALKKMSPVLTAQNVTRIAALNRRRKLTAIAYQETLPHHIADALK